MLKLSRLTLFPLCPPPLRLNQSLPYIDCYVLQARVTSSNPQTHPISRHQHHPATTRIYTTPISNSRSDRKPSSSNASADSAKLSLHTHHLTPLPTISHRHGKSEPGCTPCKIIDKQATPGPHNTLLNLHSHPPNARNI